MFFSGVIVLTISNLLIKAIGALFKIPMNQIVGDLGMGYYSSAYTIYTLFYMISTGGLPVAISLLVSESRAKGRLDQVKKVSRISMNLFIIVGAVGTAIMVFGAHFFSKYLLKAELTYFSIYAIAPVLFFICISSAIRGYFQGYQFMIPVAISQLIEALCKLFLGIAFAYYAIRKYGVTKEDVSNIHYVAAYAVLGVTIGAGLGMLFLIMSKTFFKSAKYDMEYVDVVGEDHTVDPRNVILKRIIMIALPVTVSASVMSLTNTIDMALIQNLLQRFGIMTQKEATAAYGNYSSLCVPLFNLPPYLIYPIGYSLVPLIKTTIVSGDRKRADVIMESTLRVAVIIGLPCALGMAALSGPILKFIGYRAVSVSFAAPLLSLLAPSTFFLCVLAVTNSILQANGYAGKPVISMLAGAAVKIASNLILTRFIGIYGTPISTFLCYLTATGLNFAFVIKYAGVRPKMSRIFVRPLVSAVVCALTAVGVYNLFDGRVGVRPAVLLAILAAAIVYVIAIFAIRAITEEDIKLLPKGEKLSRLVNKQKKTFVILCVLAVCATGALTAVTHEKEPDVVDFDGTWRVAAVNVGGEKSFAAGDYMVFGDGKVQYTGSAIPAKWKFSGEFTATEEYLTLADFSDKYLIEDVTDNYVRLDIGLENYIDIVRCPADETETVPVTAGELSGTWEVKYRSGSEYESEILSFADGAVAYTAKNDGDTVSKEYEWYLSDGVLTIAGMEADPEDGDSDTEIYAYAADSDTLIFIEMKSCTVWELEKVK